MQSPFTGKEMKVIVKPAIITIRKEPYTVMHRLWQCQDTMEEFEYDIDSTIQQAEDQYRSAHNLPFPEEIKQIREQYGISGAKMSAVLRFGVNQYRQYENGELPSESNASLIFLARDPKGFGKLVEISNLDQDDKTELYQKIQNLQEKMEYRYEEKQWFVHFLMNEGHPNLENGFKSSSLEKFGSLVQFFAFKMSPFKTQLNKLLFYSDFSHFRKYGRSITGARYRAIAMGPVPNNFDGIFQYIENEGFVKVEHAEYGNGSIGTRFFSDNQELSEKNLSEQELETAFSVLKRFEKVSTSEIIEISHDEAAWKKNVKNNSIISYMESYVLSAI